MGPRAKPGVAAGEGFEPSFAGRIFRFDDNRSLSNAWILPFYARRPGRVSLFPYLHHPAMYGRMLTSARPKSPAGTPRIPGALRRAGTTPRPRR